MLVIGHRGSPLAAPENTIESFRAALASGADGVELDCRMTADGALVVRHDEELPDGRMVSRVRAADAGLPTLHESLDAVAGHLCVVELKSQSGRTAAFVEAVGAEFASRPPDGLIVSSFDHVLLREFRRRIDVLRTALTVGILLAERDAAWAVDEAEAAGHLQIHAERRVFGTPFGEVLLEGTRRLGLDVLAWTVNDADEAAVLERRGVAGVITDVPGLIAGRQA